MNEQTQNCDKWQQSSCLVNAPQGTPRLSLGTQWWHLPYFQWIVSPPVAGFKMVIREFSLSKPWFDWRNWLGTIWGEGSTFDRYDSVFHCEGVLSSGFNLLTWPLGSNRIPNRVYYDNVLSSTALWWLQLYVTPLYLYIFFLFRQHFLCIRA